MLRASSGGDDELEKQLSDTLSSTAMKALLETIEGNPKSPSNYFGSGSTSPRTDTGYPKGLAADYPNVSEEFLNRLDNEFKPRDIATNKTQDYLVETFDIDRDLVEGTSKDFSSLLTLIYLLTYDASAGELSAEYETLIALATIFKGNNETIYYHDDVLPLDNIETNIGSYIRHVNKEKDRPQTVRKYGSKEAVVLKVFSETSKTRQAVFECRREGASPPTIPSVTHEPRFNVKTIRVKGENVDGRGKITLSKSKNGWQEDLETLFEYAFQISGGFDGLEQKILNGATHMLDTAIETAESDDEEEDTVTERIHQEVESLAERTLDKMEADGVDEDTLSRAEARFGEIEFIGVRIYSDEDTHMAEFVLRSADEYEDVANEVDDLDASLTALLAKVNPENVRLIFRTTDIDGKTQEEFEVGRGRWYAKGRGVPEEAIQMLDQLFETMATQDE